MADPLLLRIYRIASAFLAPLAYARARKRLLADGIPKGRLTERWGNATLPRPTGQLIWFHAASIGESLSILPLLEELQGEARFLVTSGTGTSAKLLAQRLPEGGMHQFVPLDTPRAAQRFFRHWHPQLAVFVESEVWPNLLLHQSGPTWRMLINARLSKRSLARWAKSPGAASAVFSRFFRIVAQDQRTMEGLEAIVPGRVTLGGNMKAAAAPLPFDKADLAKWRSRLADRPCWVASSTHEGEDEAVLDAHASISDAHPGALLILVPRHPTRGMRITEAARRRGFETARLGGEEPVGAETAVLVADTLGQLGLWYRVAPLVFLAGSFGDAGGHNPWEAIRLGAALFHGPNVANAAADYRDLDATGAAIEVADAGALARAISGHLSNPAALSVQQEAARAALSGADELVIRIADDIRECLKADALSR